MSKVSVIIPCYNDGLYLDEAVESVLNQSFKDLEIIIVNDGSTDEKTNSLLHKYVRPKTKILQSTNLGVAAARNLGIAAASGQYILPLDADDIIETQYIEKAINLLDADIDIGIVYCQARYFGELNKPWKQQKYSIEKMLIVNLIFSAAVFRKEDWLRAGGYNENMKKGFEDWDYWLSIIELGKKTHRIEEILFCYRIKKKSRSKALSNEDFAALHTQIFYNHQELFVNNIRVLFDEIYNPNYLKSKWFKKIRPIIRYLTHVH